MWFLFSHRQTSFRRTEDEAKRGLSRFAAAVMKKINFAGDEPFMYPKFLGPMIAFCKEQLRLESSNAIFSKRYGKHNDIIAVSCDSLNEQTNIEIGRGSGNQVDQMLRIADWCREFGIKFKLNTVVCNLNYMEDINAMVEKLQPFRWKCFQGLKVAGEKDSDKTLHQPCFVPEPHGEVLSYCG
ncbi:hypothetical protein AJ79_01128 [Helicocarpus griseus UAMH5409]|uniref:Radical SAM core domain-containing protein n=1 Tax=Helicocarpus griseus UAMH5409 TaxID=1447875 RepID=A0A2B7Y9D4_9EURO|nr:hypothetical protein AJ79_01128 [Helicocarpus griseus UAMH5409]